MLMPQLPNGPVIVCQAVCSPPTVQMPASVRNLQHVCSQLITRCEAGKQQRHDVETADRRLYDGKK
jgi:hypothetical protein